MCKGKGRRITKSSTKKVALVRAKRLRRDGEIALPKYRWAKNIMVEEI